MSELSLQGGFLAECEREQLHRLQAIQPFGLAAGSAIPASTMSAPTPSTGSGDPPKRCWDGR